MTAIRGRGMAAKRKTISKMVRFEVFKRDGFTCQYCGKAAPDVVLHVDHISPVAKGGGNEILNLITSCACCNGGKGARELDDNSILARQRQQLVELSEKREQLELMVAWRTALLDMGDVETDAACDLFERLLSDESAITEDGRKTVRRLVRKHGLRAVMDAMETSVARYETGPMAFSKIETICNYNSIPKEVQDQKYIFGILRNRLDLSDPAEATEIIESIKSVTTLVGADEVRKFAKAVKTDQEWWMFVVETEHEALQEVGRA